MNRVYLDNAATTQIDQQVVDAMLPILTEQFGNPSSIHSFGRETRSIIEKARKSIAALLNTSTSEIFFTSGGTEANNMAICSSIKDYSIKHVISSALEHHAVLHTLENLAQENKITLHLVQLSEKGEVDLAHLESLLQQYDNVLVSLMHANNEIGNILAIETVQELCGKYKASFHSDTVQTMAHYPIDLQKLPNLHFLNCSAHKFHGPKGIGFIYINSKRKIKPFIHGGAQERNMRGGTENIYGIVGLAKAMEIAHENMEKERQYISSLKQKMVEDLKANVPDIQFNGDSESKNSLYTVLNVSLPPCDFAEMLLFRLDMAGVAASGGSACSSGTSVGSHVLNAIKANPERPAVRFSFSKFNTAADIDFAVNTLKEMYLVNA